MKNLVWIVAFMVLALTLSGLHVAYITKRDTYAMEKYTKVMAIWTYLTAAVLYLLGVYYFQVDETYILQAVLAGVMLFCLPATLVTMSVALITGGNI